MVLIQPFRPAALLGIILLVGVVTGCREEGSGGRIHFAQTEFDFGPIWQGVEHVHNFEFENLGSNVLKIGSVRSDCGCTTARPTDSQIEPGASGRITVGVQLSMLGPFEKHVRVPSSDRTVGLTIRGEVVHFFNVKPNVADFGAILPSQRLTRQFDVRIRDDAAVESLMVEDVPPYLQADLSSLKSSRYRLVLTLNGPQTPGELEGSVVLTARRNGKATRIRQELPVRMEVARICLDRPKLDFGSVELGRAAAKTVTVALDSTLDRRRLRAYASSGRLISHIEADDDSDACRLVVGVAPDAAPGPIVDKVWVVAPSSSNETIASSSLDVQGEIRSALQVTPAQVFLGAMSPGDRRVVRFDVGGLAANGPIDIKLACTDRIQASLEEREIELVWQPSGPGGWVVGHLDVLAVGQTQRISFHAYVLGPSGLKVADE